MFEELIKFEPEVEPDSAEITALKKAAPAEVIDAQVETADWLKALGAATDEVTTELETEAARKAFSNFVTAQPQEAQIKALEEIKTPAAVQHLVGMLTAYDWEFISQAKELRGYTVAKILEETNHPTASVRLKALALLGKVTEVGLFTEKIEVKKTEMSDLELEARIKEKLGKLAKIVDITDVKEVREIECQTIDIEGESGETGTDS
jgi:HEAT repeat protein